VTGVPLAREATERLQRGMPFARLLGIEITSDDPAELRARMQWTEERTTGNGVLHGGALLAFADSVGALCAGLNSKVRLGGTLELKCNFLRPVTAGTVHSVTRPIHVGRSTVVVQTELFDDDGRRVALVTQTQAARREA
jgi:1,4-dihydroxy-2-naphthoyl-CoA hydrolase